MLHAWAQICDEMRDFGEVTTYAWLAVWLSSNTSVLINVVSAVVQLVEYRTRNREVAGSTHTWSTASNLEQVANLLCAQANSASYPQRNGK